MKVVLILIAMHINNPADRPGKATLEFDSMAQCEKVLSTLEYELKFKSFKVVGECQRKS